jgi:hypothetical protein
LFSEPLQDFHPDLIVVTHFRSLQRLPPHRT